MFLYVFVFLKLCSRFLWQILGDLDDLFDPLDDYPSLRGYDDYDDYMMTVLMVFATSRQMATLIPLATNGRALDF